MLYVLWIQKEAKDFQPLTFRVAVEFCELSDGEFALVDDANEASGSHAGWLQVTVLWRMSIVSIKVPT